MAAALTLYHAVHSRSFVVRWMLEELGEPYEVELINLREGEQLQPGFLALNSMGKVPVLRQDDMVITESAAICTYLADAFPEAGLNKPIGDPDRGPYLKWLFFGPSVIEPMMMDNAFPRADTPPRATLGYGDAETVCDVVAHAVSHSDYLFGDHFTAADVVVGSALRFGLMFGLLPARDEFKAYVGRLEARPAMQRAVSLDEELAAA